MIANVFTIGAVVCSLPALLYSMKRVVKEKSMLNMLLVVTCLALTATYVSAVFHTDDFLLVAEHAQSELGVMLTPTLLFGTLFALSLVASGGLFLFVRFVKEQNFWLWTAALMLLFLLTCLLIGFVGGSLTGRSWEACFYDTCCGAMGVSGIAWGLSYKEICVIGNIYLQPAACMLSALWLTWVAIKRFFGKKNVVNAVLMTFAVVYGLVYVAGFLWICQHYAMPMVDAFNLCYRELLLLASRYHTTYNNVNYFFFILLFFVPTVGNLLLAKLIRR